MSEVNDDGWVLFDEDGYDEEVIEETEYARKTKLAPCEIYMNVYTGEVEVQTADEEAMIDWEWKGEAYDKVIEHMGLEER